MNCLLYKTGSVFLVGKRTCIYAYSFNDESSSIDISSRPRYWPGAWWEVQGLKFEGHMACALGKEWRLTPVWRTVCGAADVGYTA